MIVNRLARVQLDRPRVIFECLFHIASVAVDVGKIIVNGRVVRIQRERLFQLLLSSVPIVDIAKEAAISDARFYMVWVFL